MAEKLHIQPEAPNPRNETVVNPEHHRSKEHSKEHHESEKHQQAERLHASREAVERQAKSTHELRPTSSSERDHSATMPPTKELQQMARDRILRSIRRKLPASEQALSKFVHSKPVETVSAVGEKTIARPYGLLGGGLAAFIGTALTFYMAKHYGFKYNLFLFFTFFVAGYIIATVLEVISSAFRRHR